MTLTAYFVAGFGIATAFAGVWLLITPSGLFDLLREHKDTPAIYAVAILVRLALGTALLMVAAYSRFPLALQILGWVALAAAGVLLLMGRQRFTDFIDWALDVAIRWGRLAGIFAGLLGGFLFYAVV